MLDVHRLSVLEPQKARATWMQSDYHYDYSFINNFKYKDDNDFKDCVKKALGWAENTNEKRKEHFNNLYSWRKTTAPARNLSSHMIIAFLFPGVFFSEFLRCL